MGDLINRYCPRQARTDKKTSKYGLAIITFIIIHVFFHVGNASEEKIYQKNYYESGALASEGWILNGMKTAYWKFYFPNGQLKSEGHYKKGSKTKYWKLYRKDGTKHSEGHFVNDKKNDWWLFYDTNEKINHKCQLKNNQKNGYCLMYKNEELVSAVKYSKGKKIKEWTDFSDFKKENRLKDLR